MRRVHRSSLCTLLIASFALLLCSCSARDKDGSETDLTGEYQTCVPLCDSKECGDDGCGGSCGNCPAAAPICTDGGLCVDTCAPACNGLECGPDGCGGTCGTCPQAAPHCDPQGMCQATCNPNCVGRECGDDGCGGSCGTCPAVAPICSAGGSCQLQCNPSCAGRTCGDDGCGGSCGTCSDSTPFCDNSGNCVGNCTADCAGKQCGDDGCGGSCGTCSDPTPVCSQNGTCVANCTPNCIGMQCGDDGCGGSCGDCGANGTCFSGGCLVDPCLTADCGAHAQCDTTYGYALCDCDVGYFNLGSGCQQIAATHYITGDVEFDCTLVFSGHLSTIGQKTIRFHLLFDQTSAVTDKCWDLMHTIEHKCLIVSGTIVGIGLDGVSTQVQTLFGSYAGLPLEMRFVSNLSSIELEIENYLSPIAADGSQGGFQFGSHNAALPLNDDYPVWQLPLPVSDVSLHLFYYANGVTDMNSCYGTGFFSVFQN